MNRSELFIDHFRWLTVPLKGTIERLDNGKKTTPQFPTGWRSFFSKNRNEDATDVLGLLTGSVNQVVVVDCDDDITVNLMESLDPHNEWKFKSVGKVGCSWVYTMDDDTPAESFSLTKVGKLDYLANGRLCFLPTDGNKTKEWKQTTAPPPLMPMSVRLFIQNANNALPPAEQGNREATEYKFKLGRLVEKFIASSGEYDPKLFGILTPKSFRTLPEYVKNGSLHPNEIPEGLGSEYLSKVSAILGADESVNRELYFAAMTHINQLWDEPFSKARLNGTIIEPMIKGEVKINDQIVWKYNEGWDTRVFSKTTLDGHYIESFFDPEKNIYFVWNITQGTIKQFQDKSKCLTYLKSITGEKLTETTYDQSKQLVRTFFDPTKPFGGSGTEFNLATRSSYLAVLNDPESLENYRYPINTVKYLETLIPDESVRTFFLRFLRTKLTTFAYSPIIPMLLGVSGSGKDTLISLLGIIVGKEYVANPEAKTFLETHNGFLLDKYFVQLDEYGDTISSLKDKGEALGRLKTYSGSDTIQIRRMGADGYSIKHNITFILTANRNPLALEAHDRRILYIKTPNRLDQQQWVAEGGGISKVIHKIRAELTNFCYYLATEYENLSSDEYVTPLETKDKDSLILESMPIYKRISYLTSNDSTELINTFHEVGLDSIGNNIVRESRVYLEQLFTLYEALGGDLAETKCINLINKELAGYGVAIKRTTRHGQSNVRYVDIVISDALRKENEDFAKEIAKLELDLDI